MKRAPAGWFRIVAGAVFLIVLPALPGLADAPRLKVLTFNVWGIVGAEESQIRAAAIGHKIAELDPDIVALEEAWVYRDRKVLFDHLKKAGYEYKDWRYVRNLYGSGLLLITKGMIEQVRFESYRVEGGPANIEWLGGKGVIYARLRMKWGPVDFFHTHAIARFTDVFDAQGKYIPGDPQENDRLLQMYQIARYTSGQRGRWTRSMILAGDFNVSPEMLEYRFLTSLGGLENSFDAVNPGQNPSTYSVENVFVTQECSRIDHIFFKNFKGTEGFGIKPAAARVEMLEKFTDPKDNAEINFSDHYGLYTEFEVLENKDGTPSPAGVSQLPADCRSCPLLGYKDGVLELASSNLQAWQDLALEVYLKAYHDQERDNPLLAPLAEVIAASPPAALTIHDQARDALEQILKARYPGPPGETSQQTGQQTGK